MSEIEDVARRLDRRPGFKVVACREVGLPVFGVTALLTLQERSQIGPIEEFVLKSIVSGLDNIPALTDFLGLPRDLIAKQVGALVFEQVLRPVSDANERYALTSKGVTRIDELSTVAVMKEETKLYVDGITRNIAAIEPSDLYSGAQLESLRIAPIAPIPRRPPRPSDIRLPEVNRMFSLYAPDSENRRYAVKLEGFVRRTQILFRRAIAIAFKSDNGRAMSIAFAIDERMSEDHEIALAKSGAAEKSVLFKTLFDATKRRSEVQAANQHIQEFAPSAVLRTPQELVPASSRQLVNGKEAGRRILTLKRAETPPPTLVRTLSVYDHPPLLYDALASASRRLLIISPWIRGQVVGEKFVKELIECLRRGVQVTIAYGFGKRDKGERPEDAAATSALEALGKSFENLRLIRKGNVHAKVLLVDDRFFVTTSFNWLSFKGDPQLPMREEEGTYVEGSALVEEYFQKLESRLIMSAQSRH